MTDVNAVLGTFLELFLKSIVAIAVPTLAYVFYKWASVRIKTVEHFLSAAQMEQLREFVAVVTTAAEQSGLAGLIKDVGAAKKQYALDALQAIVDSKGWKISVEQLDAEIENAIRLGVHQAEFGDPKEVQSQMGFGSMNTADDDDDDIPTMPSGDKIFHLGGYTSDTTTSVCMRGK